MASMLIKHKSFVIVDVNNFMELKNQQKNAQVWVLLKFIKI